MLITLRPFNLETDALWYAELINTFFPAPVTVEQVYEWARNFPSEGIRRQAVALNEQGLRIGASEITRRPNMAPHTFFIEVIVAPEFQRRGIGAQLYDEAIQFARSRGATRLFCEAREDQPGALKFARARGFEIDRHIFESTLDLGSFDQAQFAGVLETVQAQGIRLFTLADAGNTETNQRQLWEVNKRDALDIPGYEGEFPRFEDFSRYVFQASWFRAEGQIFAADGDRWIGLGAVGYYAASNSAYNMHTGVFKEYRGRKIAQALKLLTIRCACEWGAAYIRTNNDSQNVPILAINRKLGYKPQPGFFKCAKKLGK